MKTFMVIGLTVLFIIAVPFTVLGEPKSKGASWGFSGKGGSWGFSVSNPNHTQALGGYSTHAWHGLSVASEHSGRVHCSVPTVTPPGPKSGTTGGTTGSSGGSGSTTGSSSGTSGPTVPSTTPL